MGASHIFGFSETRRKTKEIPAPIYPQASTKNDLHSPASGQEAYERKHSTSSTLARHSEDQGGHNSPMESRFGSASTGLTDSGTLVATGDEELAELLLTLHKKASSQVLGIDTQGHSQISEDISNQQGRTLRVNGSSSTLCSFYDPQQIPLAISQQTSDSSARDFALRKGCPPVVSVEGPGSRPSHAKKVRELNASKGTKKTASMRFDLSMLFPKPSTRHGHIQALQHRTASPDVGPDQWDSLPTVPLGPSSSQRYKSNNAKGTKQLPRYPEKSVPIAPLRESNITNSKNPEIKTKNWFDNLDEILGEDEIYDERGSRNEPSTDQSLTTANGLIDRETKHITENLNSYQKEIQDSSPYRNVESLQTLFSNPSIGVSPAQEQLRLALQNWEFRRSHHTTGLRENAATNSRIHRKNVFEKMDLQNDSVLCLSSSEDESEEEDSLESDIGNTIPGIRDSLVVGPLDLDVEFGTAHAVTTKRPKLKSESRKNNRTCVSHLSDASETTTKEGRQSYGMQSFLSDQSRSPAIPQAVSSATSMMEDTVPERTSTYFDCASTMSQKSHSLTRLMTVTPQEESLLEAMRSKPRSSSMRLQIVVEPTRSVRAVDQAKSVAYLDRHRTASVDAKHASFLHLSTGSIPTTATHGKQHPSSSSDDFPVNGSSRESSSFELTRSRRSSLARSSLPSTNSQDTPPTPTTVASSPDGASHLTSSSKKHYSTLPTGYQGRNRARTGSSNVIVLDHVDDRSSGHLEDASFPPWAFSGWSDRSELAVVH